MRLYASSKAYEILEFTKKDPVRAARATVEIELKHAAICSAHLVPVPMASTPPGTFKVQRPPMLEDLNDLVFPSFPNEARGRARPLGKPHFHLRIDEATRHPQMYGILGAVDFLRYLVQPARWIELPPQWGEIFGRKAPLCVEIGFGNGEFLAEMAQRHQDGNWVGFETSLTCIVKAGRKLSLAGVENVRLALLDGKFGLRELFRDGSVSKVFVNFPCPWPKARHAERRLVDAAFAQTLAAVLVLGGEFHLATDALWYAAEAAQHLKAAGLAVEGPEQLSGGPGTRYERKWRSRGLAIWKVLAKNVRPGTVQRIAEGPMPHAKVPTKFDRERLKNLSGLKETWGEGAVVLKEVFFAEHTEVALVRVFATDQGFTQQFFLIVSQTSEGVIVQLDGATTPFRTPAVKRAVALVAEELSR